MTKRGGKPPSFFSTIMTFAQALYLSFAALGMISAWAVIKGLSDD